MEYILSILALITAIILPHIKDRNYILFGNLTLVSLYAGLMALEGVVMGSFVYIIAAFSSLFQIFLPQLKTTAKLGAVYARIIVCITIVACATPFLYETPLDLILISAFLIARIAETQMNPFVIKSIYLVSSFIFLSYSGLSGVTGVAIAQTVLFTSLLIVVSTQAKTFIYNKTDLYSLKTAR